jgi:hypothetical protein
MYIRKHFIDLHTHSNASGFLSEKYSVVINSFQQQFELS